jgi:hypothetical protein
MFENTKRKGIYKVGIFNDVKSNERLPKGTVNYKCNKLSSFLNAT